MTIYRLGGEPPSAQAIALALTAQNTVKRVADLMEEMECSRTAALNLLLQMTLLELGAFDVDGMERLARAVSRNVAAALRGDQSGVALDDMVAACEEIEAARARTPS